MKSSLISKMKYWKEKIKAEPIFVCLLTSFALCSSALLLFLRIFRGVSFSSLEFMNQGNLALTGMAMMLIFLGLYVLTIWKKKLDFMKKLLFFSVLGYFSLLCFFGFQSWFYVFLCIFLAVAVFYCMKDFLPKWHSWNRFFLPLAAFLVFAFVLTESVFRYKGFQAGAEDMGIYTQIFYQMAKTGKPNFTLTADSTVQFLSITPSFILYLLLPLYLLFHSMTPYLVLQALALVSGIVPLFLLCKRHGLKEFSLQTVCLLYLLHPGIWAGAFYDFHEQAFLPPILLWILYFAEKESTLSFLLFSVLALTIGKEGQIFVFFIGLYVFFGLKRRMDGAVAMLLSILTFALYKILYFENIPVLLVIFGDYPLKAWIGDPGYILHSLFTEEKLVYLLTVFLPLAGLPFFLKKRAAYLLFLPLFPISLLSSLSEDSSVLYQHSFGVTTLMLYLFLLSFASRKEKSECRPSIFALSAALLAFSGMVLSHSGYLIDFCQTAELRSSYEEMMALIPENASVTASPMFTPFLAERDTLYLYTPDQVNEDGSVLPCPQVYLTEYTILSLHGEEDGVVNTDKIYRLISEGFEIIKMEDGVAAVLRRQPILNG